MVTFTPSLFFQHATCPHWIWHDRFSDPVKKGDMPELAEKLIEQGVVHEAEYIDGLDIEIVEEVISKSSLDHTIQLMQQGVPYIYHAAIEYTDAEQGVLYRGQPDLLEKRSGKSKLGNYYYAPIDIKSSSDIKREHWLQLGIYAQILEQLQGMYPAEVAIINRDHDRLDFTLTDVHVAKIHKQVNEILQIMAGEKPPLKLASKCKNSPWFQECIGDAEAADDIALIYKLDSRAADGLRKLGIKTVTELAKADISRLPKIQHLSVASLQRAQLQAQSLKSRQVTWLKNPDIPTAQLELYFDIEGDPLLQVEYLFGFWVVGDTTQQYANATHVRHYEGQNGYYVYFLAEHPEDEAVMWQELTTWLAQFIGKDYIIYHYADYERVKLNALAEKYGEESTIEATVSKLYDLLKVIQESVIFPLYFYSIKDIAKSKFLDYHWRHPKAGGAQSIFWYEKWLETNDQKVLTDIINYNEDDVVATEYVKTWLVNSKLLNNQK